MGTDQKGHLNRTEDETVSEDQLNHALVFAGDDANFNGLLQTTLKDLGILPLQPYQLHVHPVTVCVINRRATNALQICANLRKQKDLAEVPVLVVIPRDDAPNLADELRRRFEAVRVSLLFEPVAPQALRRFFTSAVTEACNAELQRRMKKAREEISQTITEIKETTEPSSASSLEQQARPTQSTAKTQQARPAMAEAVSNQESKHEARRKVRETTEPKEKSSQVESKADSASRDRRDTGNERGVQTVLPDVIPEASSLLPIASVSTASAESSAASAMVKGGVQCAVCKRWKARREDAFCSLCGTALVLLKVREKEITFEPQGEHRVGRLLELASTGQNPLRLSFNILAPDSLTPRFNLHTEHATLDSRSAGQLLITFDAHSLDLTTNYQAALEISTNEKGFSRQQLSLIVERLPLPRISAHSADAYAIDLENFWEFDVSNDGGGTLQLTRVLLDDGSSNLDGIPLELIVSPPVKSGQMERVRVRVPELELTPGAHKRRAIFRFGVDDRIQKFVELAIEAMRPPRLVLQPTELDFGIISTNRDETLSLILRNNGEEELVIKSVAASLAWVSCEANRPFPLHIPAGGSDILEVTARGRVEDVGEHRGEITIESNSFQNPAQIVPFVIRTVAPSDYEEYIGIDFGTTASCIAVISDQQPFLLPIDPEQNNLTGAKADPRIMPSVLYFQPNGAILAGREALTYAKADPANAVTSIKRALGVKTKRVLAGREYDPTELTAKIIEQLVERTERGLYQLGEYKTPRRAVATVPIEFSDNQRRALLDACHVAGLEAHTLSNHGVVIDEAHAAALYYMSRKWQAYAESAENETHVDDEEQNQEAAERVLVFDFGGGTLDCALIEIAVRDEKMIFKTLAPGGDQRLGGEDIDWSLVGLLADRAREAYPDFDLRCLGDTQKFEHHYRDQSLWSAAHMTRSAFKAEAERAKIALSKSDAVRLHIAPLLSTDTKPTQASFDVTLTRDDFEQILEPFIKRAMLTVETVCQRARVELADVDTILHAGRTSWIPAIRERINQTLPNAVDRSNLIEPKVCVALGAAFWGYIKDHPTANFEFIGSGNRLLHDLGYIDIKVGLRGFSEIFVPVFPAQTEFPCEKTIELPCTNEWLNLRLAENRGNGARVHGNHGISYTGTARIDMRGVTTQRVSVHFIINENRILEITANNRKQVIELDA